MFADLIGNTNVHTPQQQSVIIPSGNINHLP